MFQSGLDVVDGGIRHAATFENLQPLLRSLLLRDGFDPLFEIDSVLDADIIGYEAGVLGPFRLA